MEKFRSIKYAANVSYIASIMSEIILSYNREKSNLGKKGILVYLHHIKYKAI